MRVVLFYHSLLSDWNNASAPFLRGIAMELLLRGHEVCVYEPRSAWSLNHLLAEHGHAPIARFHATYPGLASRRYDADRLDLRRELEGVDLVIVHEWCDPRLVQRIGAERASGGRNTRYRLLFHATHHRCLTDPASLQRYDLSQYDGVLAAGSVLREQFLAEGWARRAWTWHEAADTRVFRPQPAAAAASDVVWVGNWREGERANELREFLIDPVRALGVTARVYGAGYTPQAVAELQAAGIEYRGWVPNFALPEIYAQSRVVVHIPARSAVRAAPGIPASRPFEALACCRPLVCAVWDDIDGLFQPQADFGVARDGDEMEAWLRTLLNNPEMAEWMAWHGQRTVQRRHTCSQRVDELLRLVEQPAELEALREALV